MHYEHGGIDGVGKMFIRYTRRPGKGAADPVEALVRGKPDWTWKTIGCGHDAMVTAPAELAEMLLAIG